MSEPVDPALERLGQQVRYRRAVLGLTQSQLAEAVGLTRSSIANLEAGRQNLPFTTLGTLAWAFDCTIGELVLTEVVELPPARFNVPALHAALDKARHERGLSWRQVAAQAQVQNSTLSRISVQSMAPNLDGLTRLMVCGWATPTSRRSSPPGRLTRPTTSKGRCCADAQQPRT